MNEFPIEIGGKEYIFSVNRHVMKRLNIDIDVTGKTTIGQSIDMIEKMFYEFLRPKQPNITEKEAMELFDVAETELEGGFNTIAEAMGAIANQGFTTNANATKKIKWLEEMKPKA